MGPEGIRIPVVPVADCPVEIWDCTMDVDLKGVFLCMKYEIKQLLEQMYGPIVNAASFVGVFKPPPGSSACDASKTGLIGLSKAASLEIATSGIRANIDCPAPTERTCLIENLTSTHPDERERTLGVILMQRMAEPGEVGEAVIWLCSDASSFVTGHMIPIDGETTST